MIIPILKGQFYQNLCQLLSKRMSGILRVGMWLIVFIKGFVFCCFSSEELFSRSPSFEEVFLYDLKDSSIALFLPPSVTGDEDNYEKYVD